MKKIKEIIMGKKTSFKNDTTTKKKKKKKKKKK